LETVLGIEHSLGRVREEVWGPRIMDIDILLYEDLELELDDLSIPHKEMHLRSFVLEPLAEIAPAVKHPTMDKLVLDLIEDLHETVLGIEHSLGRVREEVWGPRIMDIDILLYEDLELELDDLSIPHKEMHLRSFVLEPLAEIAPAVKHPTLDKLVIELKEDLERGE